VTNSMYNNEAEQATIASLLRQPDGYWEINSAGLEPSDFVNTEHRQLYNAINYSVEKDGEVSVPIIVEYLKGRKRETVVEYMESLLKLPISSDKGNEYARIVKGLAVNRKLGTAGAKIIDISQEQRSDYESALAESEKVLRDLAQALPEHARSPLAKDILGRMQSAKAENTIPLTFSNTLQTMTGGLMPGHFWVVGGFSSTGKTAVACNVALDALLYPNKHVAVVSAEMTQEQYMIRLLSILSGVPQTNISGRVTIGLPDHDNLQRAKDDLTNANLYVYDNLYTMKQIRTELTRLKNHTGLDLFILDYIQNVSVSGDEVSDAREVALECQRIAKDLSCTVVAFSQLSNAQAKYEMEGGDDNYYSLKGHGSIRDAADVVLTLHRDRARQSSALKVKFRKNRHGPMSDFTCDLHLLTGKVREIDWEDEA
jgi:replicative DNA helicase